MKNKAGKFELEVKNKDAELKMGETSKKNSEELEDIN